MHNGNGFTALYPTDTHTRMQIETILQTKPKEFDVPPIKPFRYACSRIIIMIENNPFFFLLLLLFRNVVSERKERATILSFKQRAGLLRAITLIHTKRKQKEIGSVAQNEEC